MRNNTVDNNVIEIGVLVGDCSKKAFGYFDYFDSGNYFLNIDKGRNIIKVRSVLNP